MIASYAHNFVFIKTRKTGGTSVEMYLSQHCGPEDVVTPLTFDDEWARSAQAGVLVARNFSPTPRLDVCLRSAFVAERKDEYHEIKAEIRKRGGFYNHMVASAIRRKLDRKFWKNAAKISVERHPYEKVVSRAYFNARLHPSVDIKEFIERAVLETRENIEMYSIWGRSVVTSMLRQERLEEDLAVLADKIGIPRPQHLPRAKSGYRHDQRKATEILTERQRKIVLSRHARTFALLGYEP